MSKPPTAYTLLRPGDTVIARTVQSADGLKGCTARVAGLTAATRRRTAPPSLVKAPPTYRVGPAAANAYTGPLAAEYQVRTAAPVVALTAASRARGAPPARVNAPPRNTRVGCALTAIAYTVPFGFGLKFGSTVPFARIAAALRRGTPPTAVKSPPMIVRFPIRATA